MKTTTGLKVLFYLKKNETDADGKCPVMGRINIGRTMEQFSAKTKSPGIPLGYQIRQGYR